LKRSFRKILIIIPELNRGGAQVSVLKLSVMLSKKHQVYLCVFHTEVTATYQVDVCLIDLDTPPTARRAKKLWYVHRRVQALRNIKKQHKIDTTISFLEGADYLNILSRRQDKVIVSIRGSKTSDGQISGWLGKLRKRVLIPQLYRKADTVVTVSEGLAHEMQSDYQIDVNKIVTIPNFYDAIRISQQAKQLLASNEQKLFDKPTLIHSGRFHPQKEHFKLLDIFQRVRQQMDCRLLLLGDGELKSDIKERTQSLGLSVGEVTKPADVCMLGFQSNPFRFIARANLFVFTSSWEGFPNALAEAMICGTPVISTDCPTGPRELLAPGTDVTYQTTKPEETPYGWLMPMLKDQRAIDQWIETIIRLLAQPEITKAAAAQQRMEEFSQEKIARQWFDLIEQS
jgi:glycosyltransferase involved in cell wall biosynthesis